MLLYKYKDKPIIVFVSSFFLTGIFEYGVGLILLKVLKMRLWDYTGHFLNIGGFVCFLSSFCFGIGGLLIIYLIYPLIQKIVNYFDKFTIKRVLKVISLLFIGDILSTKLNKI